MLSTAAWVAESCAGRRLGQDPMLAGVCIDSRHARRGDLFVALPGGRTDGHCFVGAAAANGAAAAMVSSPPASSAAVASHIVVDDCALALAKTASRWRRLMTPATAAVTGSNGKTTVKEMLFSIFRAAAGESACCKSPGNRNNRLGVSLSVLSLRPHHRLAVFETGMDAAGELLELGEICNPQVAVVNNAQRAHLQGFNSVAEVAAAKGELIESLSADGIAVLNADDRHFSQWKKTAGRRNIVAFGFGDSADFRGVKNESGLLLPEDKKPVRLKVAGAHNAGNALAAAAAAHALQLPPSATRAGLESFVGAPGRLQFKTSAAGQLLIDDSYNANPDSMAAAVAALAECSGDKFAALGDMLALGASADKEHRRLLESAAAVGQVFCVGEHMKTAAAAVGGSKVRSKTKSKTSVRHFDDKDSLIRQLKEELRGRRRTAVLVKGSRGMQMELVAAALEDDS